MTASLGIVVVTYNSPELLGQHLPSIDAKAVPGRVVVVDNSDQAEAQRATESICDEHGWQYVGAGGNIGFGAGVNLGVADAGAGGATAVLILNPDAWLDTAAATELLRHCEAEPMTAITPLILTPDEQEWFVHGSMDPRRGRLHSRVRTLGSDEVMWLTGASLAMSITLWEQVGGFDERYFLYWEDVDLSWRILQAGGELEVLADLVAYHAVGGTQSGDHKSPPYVFYNCRNRLFFARLHMTRSDQWRWLVATPAVTWDMIRRGGRTRAAWFAAGRGVAAGLGMLLRSNYSLDHVR